MEIKNKILNLYFLISGLLFVFSINTNAQNVFSDISSIIKINQSEFFDWNGNNNIDTISIYLSDTTLAIHDHSINNFYINVRTIDPFLYFELITNNSEAIHYNLPQVYAIGDKIPKYLPLPGRKNNGKLTGRFYSLKNTFNQITIVLISSYRSSNMLHIVINGKGENVSTR